MRNTKIQSLIKTVVVALLVMVLSIPTTVFSETVKSVEVSYNGVWQYADYDFSKLTEQEKDELTHQFIVSNVIGTFDSNSADDWEKSVGLIAKGPVQITALRDDALVFSAYKATEDGASLTLPVEGKYMVFAEDETSTPDEYGNRAYVEKLVTESELGGYDMAYHVRGNTITLTEPGEYVVNFRYEAMAGAATAIIRIGETDVNPVEQPVEKPSQPVSVNAVPTDANVLVNGKVVSFNAYNIAGSNYFKLRDLASAVNATDKQFEVQWDEEKRAINLISGDAYTLAGSEMLQSDGLNKTGTSNTSPIYKDGSLVKLTAYTIDGSNFFKLRDVAQLFDIGITWDGNTNTIGIDTTIGYTVN